MINQSNFLKGLKNKNPKALDYVVDTYSNIIFKVAYGILNNRQLSEECLNDVLLKIWDNAKHFNKGEESFVPWVMAIAKYSAIDILRKEVRHSNTVDIAELQVGQTICLVNNIDEKERLKEVTKEINSMKDIDKEIFLRKFYLEESSKNISEKMGLTDKFINLRIFRGRKKLKEKFCYEEN